jgi:hypothetical protein
MAARYRVSTPVPGFSGESAGVVFAQGVAEVGEDQAAQLAYFRGAGYHVEDIEAETPAPDGRESAPKRVLPGDAPNRSASKADWLAYAVAKGVDAAEAEAATRDQLVERFTTEETQP